MANYKTCIKCGDYLRGSDCIGLRSYCSACSRKASTEAQNKHVLQSRKKLCMVAKYYRDLPVKVTNFKYSICWFKFNDDGFYEYSIFKGIEEIHEVYKWTDEPDIELDEIDYGTTKYI